mmetsp:Transcript_88325/g.248763  ORF Transcript_88325/g.248763 Transcript_88325/m.248763 type:complete len:205 (+) Transcript_88325:741-1355(+)
MASRVPTDSDPLAFANASSSLTMSAGGHRSRVLSVAASAHGSKRTPRAAFFAAATPRASTVSALSVVQGAFVARHSAAFFTPFEPGPRSASSRMTDDKARAPIAGALSATALATSSSFVSKLNNACRAMAPSSASNSSTRPKTHAVALSTSSSHDEAAISCSTLESSDGLVLPTRASQSGPIASWQAAQPGRRSSLRRSVSLGL